MRALSLIAIFAFLWGCKTEEPQNASPRIHSIELSEPYEVVEVSVAGRDDLKVSVFERDGRLVAAVIDQRSLPDDRIEQIQRWEMLAKSNKEVALTTRKDFHWLKYTDSSDGDSEATSTGTVVYSDTNGDGTPDYQFGPDGLLEVSTIGYKVSATTLTSSGIQELPPVHPEEIISVPPKN